MRRVGLLLGITAVFASGSASAAAAGGPPILVDDAGLRGVPTASGFRYVALEGRDQTVVARISPNQRVVALRFLPGRFTIPAVANDGSPGGLSADGKTLVLIRPRPSFPRAETSFMVLDPRSFRVHATVTLRGDFSFDAISPDGSLLYFIQYLSPKDPTKYAVRAYDVEADRLQREPIVDRTEPDEKMGGNPITRVTSADGRWAYTLYDGAGSAPFVHALDTVEREAHCIDLEALAGRNDLSELRLRLDRASIAVVSQRERVAVIDTATLQVREPGEGSTADGTETRWPAIGVLVALLAATAVSLLVRRRRRLSPV